MKLFIAWILLTPLAILSCFLSVKLFFEIEDRDVVKVLFFIFLIAWWGAYFLI